MQKKSSEQIERDRKYAWDFFQLHSSQRIASFNFYITLATALLASICAVLQPAINLISIALILSILLIIFSFILWKLDQRNRMLIKCAEEALKEIESNIEESGEHLPFISLFKHDEQLTKRLRGNTTIFFWHNYYSYSDCFNVVFLLFGLLGILGMVFSIVKIIVTT
jgi:ABC-type multidrug transport system fused ATPase/permease subunit